jgi:G8 domain
MPSMLPGRPRPVRGTSRARSKQINAVTCETLESRCLLAAGVTVTPTSGLFTTGYGETTTFSVVLNTAPKSPVTIPVSSSNVNQGTVYPSTVTFTPNNWDLPQLVQVTGVDDRKADGNINYNVVLAKTTSSDPAYSNIDPADVAVVNKNYEVAGVSVWPSSNLMVSPGKTTTFEVGLTTAPTATVTIPISSSNTSVGRASTSVLVFTATNWQTPQTVTVTGQNLAADASNTAFSISLANTSSSDPKFNKIGATTVTATNVVNRAAFEAAATTEANAYMQNESMGGPPMMGGMPETDQMMQDDLALMQLVPVMNATNTAIADGNWSDPNTWMNKQVPAAGANVWIMPGRTVTVDQQFTTAVNWVRVNGSLRFNPHTNTQLRVDTIIVGQDGVFMMGSQAEPVDANKTAVVSFTDGGSINGMMDPHYYGRGLVSMGTNYIQGAVTTAFAPLVALPKVGDTKLTFPTAPTNWRVGDSLVMGGLVGFSYGEQAFTIAAVSLDGKTVTVNTPVNIQLRGYATADQQIFVADLTRNVLFKSENATTDPLRNGHVMFMHTPNVTARYAEFLHLGRTAGGPDQNDNFVPTISGIDPRGRYAFHLHMDGDTAMTGTQVVQGCVVDGSPGWGYDNHGSHAIMTDNVAHNAANAGFVTEDGDESGVFARNMAIGGKGFGFWMHGPGVAVNDNVATGFTAQAFAGFFVFASTSLGLDGNLHYMAAANLSNSQLVDPYAPAGQIEIEVVPIYFARNIAYANFAGYSLWNVGGSIDPLRPNTIQGGVLWNTTVGVDLVYSSKLTLRNIHMASETWSPAGTTGDAAPNTVIYDNLTITGFIDGIEAPYKGFSRISDGFFNNLVNIKVPFGAPDNGAAGTHVVDIRGPVFGNLPAAGHPTNWVQNDIVLDSSNVGGLTGTGLWPLFAPNQILFNGQQLYFSNQLPSYVVTGTGVAALDGKTNAQLYSQYTVSTGGEPAPAATATQNRITGGVIGAPVAVPSLVGVQFATRLANWNTGLPGPIVNLTPGWNLVPVTFQGAQRYMFVYGPAANTTSSAARPLSILVSAPAISAAGAAAPVTVSTIGPDVQPVTKIDVSSVSQPMLPTTVAFVGLVPQAAMIPSDVGVSVMSAHPKRSARNSVHH